MEDGSLITSMAMAQQVIHIKTGRGIRTESGLDYAFPPDDLSFGAET